MATPVSPPNSRHAPDALDTLIDDGSRVRQLFKAFDELSGDADPSRKAEIARAICREIDEKTRGAGQHH